MGKQYSLYRSRKNARLETGTKREVTKKKYALHPGFVTSRIDGDRHFITAQQLARLWGVPLRMCVVIHDDIYDGETQRDDNLHHLYPLYNGRYRRLEK